MCSGFGDGQRYVHCTAIVFLGVVLACSWSLPLTGSSSLYSTSDDDAFGEVGYAMSKRGPSSAMWFGPRLGRRERRSTDDMQDDGDVGRGDSAIVDMLRDSPWALIALKGNRRHTVNFTPRLGRDSSAEDVDERLDARAPPFSPRLGRRLVPFSPRLGRENDGVPVVYSPRLGRNVATDPGH